MGSQQSSVGDANYEFNEVIVNTNCNFTCPYPSNQQFQLRVKHHEWNEFMEEFGNQGKNLMKIIAAAFVVLFIAFIVGIALTPFSFIIWVIMFPITFVLLVRRGGMMQTIVDRYNAALFNKRGIRVTYHQGGKHSPSILHFTMAYPANSLGGDEAPSPDLEARFRQANEEFSRSAIASAAGPVANAVNVNTGTTSSGGGFQVQIPTGASPGSIIQVIHNGQPVNITVPPGAQPGSVITVPNASLTQAPQQLPSYSYPPLAQSSIPVAQVQPTYYSQVQNPGHVSHQNYEMSSAPPPTYKSSIS